MADEPQKTQAPEEPPIPQPFEIPVLPLQNTTLFPETVVPLAVGRDRSMLAVESALATEEKLLGCITTKTENVTGDDAKFEDLYKVGTIVNIKRMMRNEGVMQLIVQGLDRGFEHGAVGGHGGVLEIGGRPGASELKRTAAGAPFCLARRHGLAPRA